MKKSSTIHVEGKVWDEIDEYMKENNITSRNTAIEWMFVERRLLLKLSNNLISNNQENLEPSRKDPEKKIKSESTPTEETGITEDDVMDNLFNI